MNTISKIIYLNRINSINIASAIYECECGHHDCKIDKNFQYMNKIRICKSCNSFMHGMCIKDDNTKCVACTKSYWYCMCGICGKKMFTYNAHNLYDNSNSELCYKTLCDNCYQNIKN